MSMLISKHAAELCAHVVNDLFGELPARIIAILLSKGRSTIPQLVRHTSLPPRQMRHGLAVLVQQNLLYHHAIAGSSVASYEANPDACYNLVRSGKIIDMVGTEYGLAEQEVFQTIMQLGHARVSDLVQAFGFHPDQNGANGGHSSDGRRRAGATGSAHVQTLQDLHTTLGRLIIAELIDQVGPKTFRNIEDVYREIEEDALRGEPGEKLTAKHKEAQQETIISRCVAAREESKKLKRQLMQTMPFIAKRRKLTNGVHSNGSVANGHDQGLGPDLVLKVNFEKCLVDLRNQTLAQYASDHIGEVTGQVYHTLLRLLSDKIARCRMDPRFDLEPGEVGDIEDDNNSRRRASPQVAMTALQILDALDPSICVAAGVGKAARKKINHRNAEKVRSIPKHLVEESEDSDDGATLGGDGRDDDSDDNGDSDDDEDGPSRRRQNGSGTRGGRVMFEDETPPKHSRLDEMRQHLLLLAESPQGFVRHCGTQGRGQFTVDFKPLMESLRQVEVDAVIEQTFGRHGLRLTRILRAKGKLDEKTLPGLALMKKSDVQGKMLALQMAGFVDVQEVPRDNSRTANRTMFFWFFDATRVDNQLMDDVYKTMLRCLQTLDVQRHRERNILSFVDRKDVKGKEEEVMTAEHYNKYSQFLDLQSKLLGQVMRLDELISVFKDY
ncbi:hypothetical protein VDGD_04053 [Verticillium dahliae]|nr:Putative endo-beta-1,4-glucanase D [Verticillium dahliae VDG1]RBQ88871.1 hypothetical protein VDGD_04053 [Verticillium dahliae]